MSLWKPYEIESDSDNDNVPLDLSVQINRTDSTPAEHIPSTSIAANVCPLVGLGVLSPPITPDSPKADNRFPIMVDVDALEKDPSFLIFENNALRAISETNGGSVVGHNPRMRRTIQIERNVDDFYRKQRERNNIAAKQSRDKRKLREIRLAVKVTYLSNEIARLKRLLDLQRCTNCRK
ncbi:transcription factor VBP-like [Melitaea cinxia]|uniref:transcription factor VBP-like n=1 Tax=Melitaea cinxia TaxID=113334 RepID=UPI001E27314C|nr:transcription factor VBP-like [Melitaea cinxia]